MTRRINDNIYTRRLTLTSEWNEYYDLKIQEEIHKSGEFEFYFGFPESMEALEELTIKRNLFYAILENTTQLIIGYLGITNREEHWEPEIYVFENYRQKGYGIEALRALINEFYSERLIGYEDGKGATVKGDIAATVRKENMPSQKMLKKVGFKEEGSAIEWCLSLEDEDDFSMFSIVKYSLDKREFMEKAKKEIVSKRGPMTKEEAITDFERFHEKIKATSAQIEEICNELIEKG